MARTQEALMGGEEGDQLVIELPGGGSLGYAGFGDPDGVPCFAFHGQSSSRLMPGWMFPPELLTAAGVRMIGVDRSGVRAEQGGFGGALCGLAYRVPRRTSGTAAT
jgi:hypothetical protein